MGLLTTTIGSFPRSAALRRARWQVSEGEIDAAALREVEDEAIRQTIAHQERLGFELLVDGQFDRGDLVTHFADSLEGMEIGGLVRCFDNRYYRRPRIIGPLERRASTTVDRWKAAQALTRRPLKAILTGPYTLMDWSFDEYYPSREACCNRLTEIVRAEALELVEAGAAEVQIDEPAISGRPSEIGLVQDAVARVVEPLRGRARTWLHASHGDLTPVVSEVLSLPVDGLLLGMVNARYAWINRLDALPDDKLLGAGVIDVVSSTDEGLDGVRSRIEQLLEKVPADRLWVVPDAGLRSLTEQEAGARLDVLSKAAASF
jgi:5-methyltetrahydropteroyltriglutamate--homocysteine methyltransferase